MKFFKLVILMMVIFSITVCSVSAGKVLCDVDKNDNIASIYVLNDEKGTDMSESDIMVFISDEVKKCTENKIETVILTITEGIANEENIAKIIDGIDVICVNSNVESKKNCIIDNTTIVYANKSIGVAIEDENSTDEKPMRPVEILFSKLMMCLVLLIIAVVILLIVKRKRNNA